MLLSTFVAAIVAVTRLLFPFKSAGAHRFTASMLLGTAASALLIPWVAERADATGWIGANTSWLLQHLLTVLALHAATRATHLNQWPPRRWWWWRGYTVLTLITLLVTYVMSVGFHTRVPDFGVHRVPTITHDLIWVTYIAASVVVLLATAADGVRRRGGIDQRVFVALVAGYGLGVLVADAATAALLIAYPAWLATHFHRIEVDSDIPVLTLLSAAGTVGMVSTWRRRHST